jgi:hypothetical protein
MDNLAMGLASKKESRAAVMHRLELPSMKTFLAVSFSFCALFALPPCKGNAQVGATSNDVPSRKWICVLDKAAGVTYNNNGQPTAGAARFEERHNKFVLTIKRVVRPQDIRERCLSNLAYWTKILSDKGTFSPSDEPNFQNNGADNKRFRDYRGNIGPWCFASDEATIKFFDRDHANTLVSYDTAPDEFVGLPGEWLRFHANKFEAGESLDLGPVVFTGQCERID